MSTFNVESKVYSKLPDTKKAKLTSSSSLAFAIDGNRIIVIGDSTTCAEVFDICAQEWTLLSVQTLGPKYEYGTMLGKDRIVLLNFENDIVEEISVKDLLAPIYVAVTVTKESPESEIGIGLEA